MSKNKLKKISKATKLPKAPQQISEYFKSYSQKETNEAPPIVELSYVERRMNWFKANFHSLIQLKNSKTPEFINSIVITQDRSPEALELVKSHFLYVVQATDFCEKMLYRSMKSLGCQPVSGLKRPGLKLSEEEERLLDALLPRNNNPDLDPILIPHPAMSLDQLMVRDSETNEKHLKLRVGDPIKKDK